MDFQRSVRIYLCFGVQTLFLAQGRGGNVKETVEVGGTYFARTYPRCPGSFVSVIMNGVHYLFMLMRAFFVAGVLFHASS